MVFINNMKNEKYLFITISRNEYRYLVTQKLYVSDVLIAECYNFNNKKIILKTI